MPTDGKPILTKNLPKVTAADLAVSDGLLGDTAARGTALITLEEAMKFLDMKRGYHVNPNLLINARWDDIYNVVNQRGLLEYTETGYTIDRWLKEVNIDIKLETDYLSIIPKKTSNSGLFQRIELEKFVEGRIYTFSILTKENVLECGNFIYNPLGNIFVQKLIANNPKHYMQFNSTNNNYLSFGILNISGENGTNLNLVAAKLEEGSVQTLAHKEGDIWVLNDSPPDYALELVKCQRYFERGVINRRFKNTGSSASLINANVYIPFIVPKRAKPNVRFEYDIQDGETVVAEANHKSKFGFTDNSISLEANARIDIHWYEASAEL